MTLGTGMRGIIIGIVPGISIPPGITAPGAIGTPGIPGIVLIGTDRGIIPGTAPGSDGIGVRTPMALDFTWVGVAAGSGVAVSTAPMPVPTAPAAVHRVLPAAA